MPEIDREAGYYWVKSQFDLREPVIAYWSAKRQQWSYGGWTYRDDNEVTVIDGRRIRPPEPADYMP